MVPNSRPFLGRLYRASERARACGSVKLSDSQVEDLKLWESFVDAAAEGISINRLVFRWPTRIVRVDACPQGMGGYGLQSGVAWRMLLSPDLIGRGSLNCLEFLAALVGVWVKHQVGGPWAEDEVLLCQGDSSSASGWITRSSFGDECPLHLAIARTMAKYMSDHRLQHYSQWFPGKENSIADALSRDFWLEDEDAVDFLKQNFAHQIPQGFRLVQLSEAIVTDVGSLLRLLPKTQLLPLRPAPSGTAAGGGTSASFVRSGTQHDSFLLGLRPEERTEVLTCFAAAIREGWTGESDKKQPHGPTKGSGRSHGLSVGRKAGTVSAAIDGVAQTYRANKLSSPAHDFRGRLEPVKRGRPRRTGPLGNLWLGLSSSLCVRANIPRRARRQ